MEQYISKSDLVAEIESKIEKYTKRGEESDAKRDGCGMYWGGVLSCLNEIRTLCDTIEVKEVGVDLGDLKGDKSAEYIIDTKTLEVKEVDLEEIIKSHFDIKNINDVKITTTGENLLNLAMRINKFVMNTAFEQYRQIGENTWNKSLDEEIEKTIKMNDMWCGLMPNTLIKYTARHFFELGLKAAQKGEEV